jgi:hypothetical protein
VLGADVGLPTLAWLPSPHFESGWTIAARIDPVGALPFMQRCLRAWATLPDTDTATCRRPDIYGYTFRGNWIAGSASQWFALRGVDSTWVRLHCTTHLDAPPGEPTQTLIRDGVEYHHFGPLGDDGTPERFVRSGAADVISVWWSTDKVVLFSGRRGDCGVMWAAGLFEMPLLTCPKEWELT